MRWRARIEAPSRQRKFLHYVEDGDEGRFRREVGGPVLTEQDANAQLGVNLHGRLGVRHRHVGDKGS